MNNDIELRVSESGQRALYDSRGRLVLKIGDGCIWKPGNLAAHDPSRCAACKQYVNTPVTKPLATRWLDGPIAWPAQR